MHLWILGSGSAGNATLLESDGTRVLIDAGFPPRVLATRLSQIGVPSLAWLRSWLPGRRLRGRHGLGAPG